MHVLSWASWLFVACIGAAGAATSDPLGVVEVDVVFPRNDTYAPTPYLPIVFGFQNTELASLLKFRIELHIWNITNGSIVDEGSFGDYHKYQDWGNTYSTDPFLIYNHYDNFNTEGTWLLLWSLTCSNCTDVNPWEGTYFHGSMEQSSTITFTTKKSAQEIDLVAATKDENCSEDQGIAINITETIEAPAAGGEKISAALVNSTATPNPCRVKIDSAFATNMSVSLAEDLCWRQNLSMSCFSRESAAQQLLTRGITCLIAVFGALSFVLI
jgi:hypothetical protein